MAGGRRFLIDGSMARSGGGFTYLVNVVPRLAARAPDDRFRLYVRSPRLAESVPYARNLEVVKLPEVGLAARLRFTYFEAQRVAADWDADVYYSAGEYAPLRAHCPRIAAFRNPNVFTPVRQGWSFRQRLRLDVLHLLARASAASCQRILFVSEDSARWIGDRIGLPESRRAVVHHGIDAEAWRGDAGAPPLDRPYVLSVSSVYRYKNFVRLIEAWAALAKRRPSTPDLVIVGDDQDPAYSARMREARERCGALRERIHLFGEVRYRDVKRWYRGASLFVFPSYLETFGHPLLEAMASDVPLVAADIPVFREIAGDAALYADPYRPEALAGAMEEALYRQGAREALRKRGAERIRRFGWDRSAAELLALFEAVRAEDRQPAPQPVRARAPRSLGWLPPGAPGPLAGRGPAQSHRSVR